MTRRVVVTTMVLGLVLVGCAGPRSSLNTSASVCFRAIPVAKDAVGERGKFAGVLRRSHRDVARRFPGVTTPSNAGPLCVVAFQGNYSPSNVRGATQSGKYAVVVVEARSRRVLHVRVTNRLPLRFHHRV